MTKFAKSLLLLTLVSAAHAAVKLPALISDHMVLQQGMPVRIWGTADAGETVRVDFQGQSVTSEGRRERQVGSVARPLVAAGPLEMTVAASNTIVIKDVMVGEVWFGSGQSNMEFAVQSAVNKDEEIARANYPLIHIFKARRAVADQPAEDIGGAWEVCSPQSIPRFSAVEYFFGRHLQQALHMPFGLIESDWGGTPAQSWTSLPALKADPALKFILDDWDRAVSNYPAAKTRYDQQLAAWNEAVAKARAGRAGRRRTGRDFRRGPGIRTRLPACSTA